MLVTMIRISLKAVIFKSIQPVIETKSVTNLGMANLNHKLKMHFEHPPCNLGLPLNYEKQDEKIKRATP